MHPTADIDNGTEFIFFVVTVVVFLGLVVAWYALRDRIEYRRGSRMGRWPTTEVREAEDGGWYWSCWYCNEASTLFPTLQAAEVSARQHTDHVDRAGATS